MTLEEVTKQLEKHGNTKEEQIRIIRKNLSVFENLDSREEITFSLAE
ncbi:MAG: hypothetical protein Q4C91_23725 [Eubacteriales bacterium]|nr:hypothetical protein [Eubacteriales bacterium]